MIASDAGWLAGAHRGNRPGAIAYAAGSDDDRLLLDGKHGRFGFVRACREISDGLALLPLRDGLLVDPICLASALRLS